MDYKGVIKYFPELTDPGTHLYWVNQVKLLGVSMLVCNLLCNY